MITRKLQKDKDFQQFSEVSASSFIHNSEETTFDENIDIFGAFINDGKVLISQIECDCKEIWYCGKPITCAAVGGVASKPEYRRSGGVRETFNAVFEHSLNKGADISILYPFSSEYYRKFGYETIFRYIFAECSFKTFEKIDRFSDVTLLTQDNKDIIEKIYNSVALKNNMMFARPGAKNFCTTPYKECKYTYFVNDGKSMGYVYLIPDRSKRTINVEEIIFTDKIALKRLLGFLRTYDGNYDFVNFNKLPVNSPVFEIISDENKLIKRSLFKGGAGRILNVENVLNATVYTKEKGEFSLKITDQQIENNNGIFIVKYENGKGSVRKTSVGDYDISLDICGASRIILGREGLSEEDINYIPNTQINSDCSDFLKAFPKATTIFYEDF